jgi:hypothetical protein
VSAADHLIDAQEYLGGARVWAGTGDRRRALQLLDEAEVAIAAARHELTQPLTLLEAFEAAGLLEETP